jgi:hypothetical protein
LVNESTGIEQGVHFDLLDTGAKQSVGWVDKHDGLLVMDRNGDGKINSGAELFGDHTKLADGSLAKDGWAALAALDSNADGSIDAKDAAFNALNVWVDANGNGITDAGELHTLNSQGITAISLNTTHQQVAQNGNVLGDKGQFTTVDGQSHDVADAWFNVNEGKTQSTSADAPQTPTHCDEPWLTDPVAAAVTSTGTAPLVYRLDTSNWQNKPYTLSAEQLAELGLPVPADSSEGSTFQLTVADVIHAPVDEAGMHVVQITGSSSDTLNLSNLLGPDQTPGQWTATGTVVQDGVTFNTFNYSADPMLQVLVDHNIQTVTQ